MVFIQDPSKKAASVDLSFEIVDPRSIQPYFKWSRLR